MIHVKQLRNKSGLGDFSLGDFDATSERALEHLVNVELAFGGRITAFSKTSITVQTRVMSNLDTTTYDGNTDEMKLLKDLACFYELAARQCDQTVADQTFAALARPEGIAPFFAVNLAPPLMGAGRLKAAIMLSAGINDQQDIRVGLRVKIGDLLAAIQLHQRGECSLRESLAIAQ